MACSEAEIIMYKKYHAHELLMHMGRICTHIRQNTAELEDEF